MTERQAKEITEDILDEDQHITVKDMVVFFIQILVLVSILSFLLSTLFFRSFFIPTASMVPTLHVGDHLIVTKYDYGYSRFSLPFKNTLFSGRILSSLPKRGDVAVFNKGGVNYVKRVMGLPGDRIQVKNAVVHINDKPVVLEEIESFFFRYHYSHKRKYPQFKETLPNNVTHLVLETIKNGSGDNTKEYIVPEKQYFMMGDNRDESSDSRFTEPVGFVPLDNFLGQAKFIYFSFNRDVDEDTPIWEKIRWSRFFKWIL